METFSLKIIGYGRQVVLDLIIFVRFQVILKCLQFPDGSLLERQSLLLSGNKQLLLFFL